MGTAHPTSGVWGMSVLSINDLHIAYRMGRNWVDVVRGISLDINKGETFGIVGESGCGKSTVAFSVMNYLGRNGRISKGNIHFGDTDLPALSEPEARKIRGKKIAMVYQNPLSSLNPSIKIGKQIAEVVIHHEGLGKAEADDRVIEILKKVHMPAPDSVMSRFPHQLSGGMQQRVGIAMALISNPDLLIMDEPTTGLDVTTEAAVLDLVNELKTEFNSAILYISHNLGVIAKVSDQVGVMYAGQFVEKGAVGEVFQNPSHPYAQDLLNCIPRLDWHYQTNRLSAIEGRVPLPTQLPQGCVFAPRCRFAQDKCSEIRPELDSFGNRFTRCLFTNEIATGELTASDVMESGVGAREDGREQEVMLELTQLRKHFPFKGQQIKAVDGINFEIKAGETFALVGESGCGKSTLGRCVVGLLEPTEGTLNFQGEDISKAAAQRSEDVRQAMQIVFQNPEATLNPQHKIGRILGRAFEFFGTKDVNKRKEKVAQLLETVKLDGSYARRFPVQLSGGEKQRVAIARAFAGDPSLIVCDEAVSALDVSVQAAVLNLLVDLKQEKQCAYLFVSHDLAVVRYISDRVGVMYLGQMMEIGTSEQLFEAPSHPYTEALLSAVQTPDTTVEQETIRLEGSVPSPLNPPKGCPFHNRCPRKVGDICESTKPEWQDAGDGHGIFCHIPVEELRELQS